MRYLLFCKLCLPFTALLLSNVAFSYSSDKARSAWGGKSNVQQTVAPDVYPLMLNISDKRRFEPYRDYLQPLLRALAQGSVYQLDNPVRLQRQYRFLRQVQSSDAEKTILSFKQRNGKQWGYISTSVGKNSIANAFAIKTAGQPMSYALVVKRLRICLVSAAAELPGWRQGQWRFSANKPGSFECTGATKQAVFAPSSGFPAVLGPYYAENDTVLVFDRPSDLKRVVQALKHQFPQLVIPVISAALEQ